MWTLLEIYEVQFIVQLRSRLWSRNISGPIISSVELLAFALKIKYINRNKKRHTYCTLGPSTGKKNRCALTDLI